MTTRRNRQQKCERLRQEEKLHRWAVMTAALTLATASAEFAAAVITLLAHR